MAAKSQQNLDKITPKIAPSEKFELDSFLQGDNQVLSGNDLSLVLYGTALSSWEVTTVQKDFIMFSLWRPNDAIAKGQYECWEIIQVEDVLIKHILKNSKKQCQCLFTGLNNKVFFFTNDSENESIELCIIDPVSVTES